MFFFWILVSLIVSVSGLPPLRKHHSHLQSGVDEADVIQPRQNLSLLFSTDASICGVASLSCMAFSSSSSEVPVRCGILTKAPVCQSYDPGTQESKCDTFCDADG
ncbi:uncharacterized protein EV154DRAFT_515235 [Mucor mucedo]|uniref:uncharacterized protein n=1 Tax=Mucor mucedo TaxID=29922 RepID=UPI00221F833A|nr:uncharacterized protein EV154DRAFT_515235 [Mucor mucedo]KAI7889179.1 hypothetical protein EV154DRAFT_515235 [Mucor mucedo]